MYRTGTVSQYVYSTLFSWPILAILAGIYFLFYRYYTTAMVCIAGGFFFLLPKLIDTDWQWASVYWPVVVVLAGLWIVINAFRPSPRRRKRDWKADPKTGTGFVNIDTTLGGSEHIIFEEVFRGGFIHAKLSGTTLDLRHTRLEEGETYIDVDATLAGIELYVPAGWEVVAQVHSVVGGVEDKRRESVGETSNRKLVLTGKLTLSGIEIKS
ncbi:MAG: cell wall-active antibiotics response protein [Alistipes sp.]|nr:cell wall-active antibiotics response protein [Alistipes sp.]